MAGRDGCRGSRFDPPVWREERISLAPLASTLALIVAVLGLGACHAVGAVVDRDAFVVHGLPLDVPPDDPRLVNAILTHSLESGRLAEMREFYGGDDPTIVYRLEDFPDGVVPDVPGFELRALEGVHPMTSPEEEDVESYLVVGYRVWAGRHDVFTGFSNAGGVERDGVRHGVLGACTNYYDLVRRWPVLVVRYAGTVDP